MQRCLLLGLILMVSTIACARPANYLLAVQTHPGPKQSRFTFVLNQKVSGRVNYRYEPNRVVLELQSTESHFKFKPLKLRGANVSEIKSESTLFGNLRFTFFVKHNVDWKTDYISNPSSSGARLQLTINDQPITSSAKKTSQVPKKITSLTTNPTPLKELFANEMAKLTEAMDPVAKTEPAITSKKSIYTIVLDPGHGGVDSGAKGSHGTYEKQVVLAIAQYLAAEINLDPNMQAVLTRNADYFIPLRQRLRLARKGQADIFIAIHADAYFDNSSQGVSVYALSKHGATSEAARWLAQKDKYPELDGVALANLKDRSKLVRSVLIDMAQTVTIRDSVRLGNLILDCIDDISTLHYRHVEQAPFVVLKSPDIPSLLIETGFITNPYEEKRLANPGYQAKIAHAIYLGIQRYIAKYG